MPQTKKKPDIYEVGDLIDKGILYLSSDMEIEMLSLQKAIFLFLYSYAVKNGYNPKDILSLASFEPYRYGPFSDEVNGQINELEGYGKLFVNRKDKKHVKLKSETISEGDFQIEDGEIQILNNIKNLVKTLEPMELTFYIYFHPAVDEELRKYYTSNSDVKDTLWSNREKYVDALLRKNVIDQETADVIIYGEIENKTP
ncbi:hypothetical protein ACNF42_07350 [Cuniculiplasma sp. SKW3]|uniref:hypothetical protein n=1 Tax=Cuniculiplasma sp. SKW3 TaxID=3400170 RepID=UPI003FD47287